MNENKCSLCEKELKESDRVFTSTHFDSDALAYSVCNSCMHCVLHQVMTWEAHKDIREEIAQARKYWATKEAE